MTSVHIPVRILGVAIIAITVLAASVQAIPTVVADTNLPIGGQALIVNTGGDGARLRSGPTTDTQTLRALGDGWRLTIVDGPINGEGGSWYRAEHSSAVGYIFANYLTTATGAAGLLNAGETVQVVTEDGAALRLRSTANGDIVGTMPHRAQVEVVSGSVEAGGQRWYKVSYEGQSGYALGAYLRPITQVNLQALRDTTSRSGARAEAPARPSAPAASNRGQLIVQTAMKYRGARYAWGGTTPAGFDCSGFVRYVVREAIGVDVGRDTFAQINAGVPVSAKDLQPGDIVFQQNTYRWGLSHVGIYIGNGKMINAQSESAGVAITDIWNAYWGPRYYAARRL